MAYALIVDDDLEWCADFARVLGSETDLELETCTSREDAERILTKHDVAIVFLDLMLDRHSSDKSESYKLLQRIQQQYPATQVVIVTGYATTSNAFETAKVGAFDFVPKPLGEHRERLALIVRNALALHDALRVQTGDTLGLVGSSPEIISLRQQIRKAARVNLDTLIVGEMGTGKEIVARAIHECGNYVHEPFIPLLLPALGHELTSNELFGHERGAYTSAHQDYAGVLERAGDGCVFLDEISEIDQRLQAQLLRVLETNDFHRLGGNQVLQRSCRVIAATNKSISQLLDAELMRPDLFYRFKIVITVPPLRDHKEDIPLLTRHFIRTISKCSGGTTPTLDRSALEVLLEHDFPGNVRELEGLISRIMIEPDRPIITRDDIVANWIAHDPAPPRDSLRLHDACKRTEKETIDKALALTEGNQSEAARLLGISRQHLHRLLRNHGVPTPLSKSH